MVRTKLRKEQFKVKQIVTLSILTRKVLKVIAKFGMLNSCIRRLKYNEYFIFCDLKCI